jgi:CBS domain-containing protein
MKIRDVMTANPEFCTPDDGVVDCARIMARLDVGIVPICESRDTRRAVGCVTDRDIVVRCVAQGKDPNLISARDAMTQELVTCSPDDDIDMVRAKMEERQVRRILVTDEHGALIGILAVADVVTALEPEKVGSTVEQISQPTAPMR